MNYSISDIIKYNPYKINKEQKLKIFKKKINQLTKHHYKYCKEYKDIINFLKPNFVNDTYPPFLHSSIFKNINLKTSKNNSATKIFNSSGTTGSKLSKIHLDFETSLLQSKILQILFKNFFNEINFDKLLIVENEKVFNKSKNTARSAAIKGLIQIIPKHEFLLNNDYTINKDKLENLKNSKNLVFGFTFMIWQNLINFIKSNKLKINLSNSFLLHGGGWKKMIDYKVDKLFFKKQIFKYTKIDKIYDYYGMMEQTGSIYFQCEEGFFHTSIFSDILIRDENLNIKKFNNHGLIQTLSLLPKSYPGHNLLTEDIGQIIGEDNCKCGRSGKFFEVLGRVKNAELRGCSNV